MPLAKRSNLLQEWTDDDDDSLVEDEVAYLTETNRQAGVEEVISEIGLLHPVIYDGYDNRYLRAGQTGCIVEF